jgi:hypothetical protein
MIFSMALSSMLVTYVRAQYGRDEQQPRAPLPHDVYGQYGDV